MLADPWFQTLFADRIGGAAYGKGIEVANARRAGHGALGVRVDFMAMRAKRPSPGSGRW